MKIPFYNTTFGQAVASRFIRWALGRPVNVYIGGPEYPYMIRRWLIPRNRFFNIYFHDFRRSDDDRALHDHPWWNISVVLRGTYLEHLPKAGNANKAEPDGTYTILRKAGDAAFRKAEAAHRISLPDGPAITLFITGRTIREWGFYCPKGWKHWKDFTAFKTKGSGNTVGPGCGET